ncbi:MAG TPA: phosphate ABC transporter permease subunit PstC [Bacteroidota bacterium]|nr:phosphate ABC transporter permease subunit PstC [Bacteroidota bacterium]
MDLSLRTKRLSRNRNLGDSIFYVITLFFALLILVLVVVMFYEMYRSSTLTREKFGFGFFLHSVWDPVLDEYGALPFIYGTVVSTALAVILAVPLSLGIAIFLSEVAPGWLEQPLSFFVELLAAIPSIVYGLWGFFVMVPWLRTSFQPWLSEHWNFLPFFEGPPYGIGMLAAGFILAIMILPIIASISRDVLRAVPRTQYEAALALGATRWQATRIALSYGRSGILGAIILGIGRALGETMAVTMVIGNRPTISISLFEPGYTMASVLANEFTEATSEMYISALIEIALVLFVITLIINSIARLLLWSMTRNSKDVRL